MDTKKGRLIYLPINCSFLLQHIDTGDSYKVHLADNPRLAEYTDDKKWSRIEYVVFETSVTKGLDYDGKAINARVVLKQEEEEEEGKEEAADWVEDQREEVRREDEEGIDEGMKDGKGESDQAEDRKEGKKQRVKEKERGGRLGR